MIEDIKSGQTVIEYEWSTPSTPFIYKFNRRGINKSKVWSVDYRNDQLFFSLIFASFNPSVVINPQITKPIDGREMIEKIETWAMNVGSAGGVSGGEERGIFLFGRPLDIQSDVTPDPNSDGPNEKRTKRINAKKITEEKWFYPVVAGASSLFLVILLIIIIVCCVKMRRKRKKGKSSPSQQKSNDSDPVVLFKNEGASTTANPSLTQSVDDSDHYHLQHPKVPYKSNISNNNNLKKKSSSEYYKQK